MTSELDAKAETQRVALQVAREALAWLKGEDCTEDHGLDTPWLMCRECTISTALSTVEAAIQQGG